MRAQQSDDWFSRKTIKLASDKQTQFAKLGMFGASKFILDNAPISQKQAYFQQSLNRQLFQRINQIDKWDFFTTCAMFNFLIHPAHLPSLIIISILSQKIRPDQIDKFKISEIQSMNLQVIQNIVYQAIYESIAYGRPYLAEAYSYLQTVSNMQADKSGDAKILEQKTGIMANLFDTTISGMKTLYDLTVGSTIDVGLSIWQYFSGITNTDPDFDRVFQNALKKLKKYGKFLIDGYFIEQNSIKQMQQGGVILYTIPAFPQLKFQLAGSFIKIYHNQNGVLKIIPQAQFDQAFLKSIFKVKIAKQNGFLTKQYNQVYNPIKGLDRSVSQFRNKYMNEFQLQQYQEQIQKQNGKKKGTIKKMSMGKIQQYLLKKNSLQNQKKSETAIGKMKSKEPDPATSNNPPAQTN